MIKIQLWTAIHHQCFLKCKTLLCAMWFTDFCPNLDMQEQTNEHRYRREIKTRWKLARFYKRWDKGIKNTKSTTTIWIHAFWTSRNSSESFLFQPTTNVTKKWMTQSEPKSFGWVKYLVKSKCLGYSKSPTSLKASSDHSCTGGGRCTC